MPQGFLWGVLKVLLLHALDSTTLHLAQGVADRIQTLENVRLSDMDNRIERAGTALVSQVRRRTATATELLPLILNSRQATGGVCIASSPSSQLHASVP